MSISKNISLNTAYITASAIDGEISDIYNLDRYVGDTMSLPYAYNDIKIPTNELVTNNNINNSLEKIYKNFLYLNAQTKLASNIFPANYRGIICTNFDSGSASVGWYDPGTALTQITDEITQLNGPGTTIFNDIVDGVFAYAPSTFGKYYGFIVNPTTFFVIESNAADTTANIKLRKTTIQDSSSLTFTNIKGIELNSNNDVFIIDDVNIYKFDVSSILTDNSAISHIGRFLIRAIGGTSKNLDDKDRFGNPVAIAVDKNDRLYVLDRKDRGIKVYDRDLNWLNTASRKGDFRDIGGNVVDIAVHNDSGYIYVLSDNGYILEYDNNLFLINKHLFKGKKTQTETFRKIKFSKKDSNLVYILSNENLYKLFKSKLDRSIGAFRLTTNGITEDIHTFVDCMHVSDAEFESVFVGSYSVHPGIPNTVSKIFKFNESTNYLTLVDDAYKTNLISLTSLFVNSGEYVTSWVINKSLHKLLYNHIIFNNNLFFKYVSEYNSQGQLFYTGSRYLQATETDLFTFKPDSNYFIGINELVLAETINRPLKLIHDVQNRMLDVCKEEISNTYPLPTQVVELN